MSGMQRHFKLRPSRSLAWLFFFLCVASLVSLWLLPLPTLVLLALTVVVLCWIGYSLLLNANLRMGNSCVAFRLEENDAIVLVLRNGRHLSGQVSADSLVTPYIVILNVVLSEQRSGRCLLILPDVMGLGSFRRLRVVLRWGDRADQPAI
jgi:toxin CptA